MRPPIVCLAAAWSMCADERAGGDGGAEVSHVVARPQDRQPICLLRSLLFDEKARQALGFSARSPREEAATPGERVAQDSPLQGGQLGHGAKLFLTACDSQQGHPEPD